jgi:hypothetical protein
MIKIPQVTFFNYEEGLMFKFVQLYVEKNGISLPYIRFEDANIKYHSDILETMVQGMHGITDFNIKKIYRGSILEPKGDKYEAIGMGLAIKDKNELNILNSESQDYEIGPNKEHFKKIASENVLVYNNSKIKLVLPFQNE